MSTPSIRPDRIRSLRRKILRFYARHGRRLPFRETTDPYRITVAEIMLQQTQVERMLTKYDEWLQRWPTWTDLADAEKWELLDAWSGLGYNRRALYLGRMAREVVDKFGGELPTDPKLLNQFPGIGPYTARAIAIFAFNQPLVTIDTNIRRVLIHELSLPQSVTESDLRRIAMQVLPPRRSRDWHNALMDYARLKLRDEANYIRPQTRQSRFAGSRRQIRGEIIRSLLSRRWLTIHALAARMGMSEDAVRSAAESLAKEGTVTVTARTIRAC